MLNSISYFSAQASEWLPFLGLSRAWALKNPVLVPPPFIGAVALHYNRGFSAGRPLYCI
jgi:hypothetical protein